MLHAKLSSYTEDGRREREWNQHVSPKPVIINKFAVNRRIKKPNTNGMKILLPIAICTVAAVAFRLISAYFDN
jgi:hypothetical protein